MSPGIKLPPLPLDSQHNSSNGLLSDNAVRNRASISISVPIPPPAIPIPNIKIPPMLDGFVTPSSSPPTFANPLPLGSPHSLGRQRLDAFDIMCLIGRGGFGKVFLVRHKATSSVYAMKVMEKDSLVQRKAVGDAHAERNILAMLGHNDVPFIVRLHVAFQTSRRVYLVMDFASGGELMFHLRREALLSEDDARFYAAELLIALELLHKMNIIHRDIKPENVLIDSNGHLILTDFGLAKKLRSISSDSDTDGEEDHAEQHSWCGSEDYMAPEIIARKQHSGKPADFWAYGVFIYDCLCGHPPFSPPHERGKTNRKRLHDRILKLKPKLPPFLTPQCHNLIRGLLTKDVRKRLVDPAKIKAHPWFAPIDWDKLSAKQLTPPFVPPCSSPTACFSPSLTKNTYSAPHSPVPIPVANSTRSSAIAVPPAAKKPKAEGQGNVWQGFSFVAPGMEVHFELAPPAVDTHDQSMFSNANGSSVVLGASPESALQHHQHGILSKAAAAAASLSSRDRNRFDEEYGFEHSDVDGALAADLEEFCVDAKEAVEVSELTQIGAGQ